MASASLTPTSSFCLSSLSSSSTTRKHVLFDVSNPAVSVSVAQVPNFEFSRWVIQPGLCQFSQWNGLKNLGISTSLHHVKIERKRKCKDKGVYASLFGVGAPEALVIGVVALLVFGPKGLTEVARNLGKTLRAFQPTIREIQEVSREFKSTLEQEIGLDDIQTSTKNTYSSSSTKTASRPSFNSSSEASEMEIDPNGSPSPSKAYSSEDYVKMTEEQLRAASATQQQKERVSRESPSEIQTPVSQQQRGTASPGEGQSQIPAESQGTPQEAAFVTPSPGKLENER